MMDGLSKFECVDEISYLRNHLCGVEFLERLGKLLESSSIISTILQSSQWFE